MRTVFLVGCPRSGTSWVRNILGAHPDVHAGPESHLFPTVHGTATTWGADPPRWDEVLGRYDALAGHGGAGPHRWIDRPAVAALLPDGGDGDVLDIADEVVGGVIDHYRCRHRLGPGVALVEKTPDHIFWSARILDRFPGARIVEIRRDGRDVCVSMERRAQRVSWPPRERHAQIARWTAAIEAGLAHAANPQWSDRWHVLRFEDLAHERRAEIGRLLAFVGLAADDALVADIAARTDIARQVGAGDGEHVRTGAIGDWRQYFDAADRELFERLAGDVLRRVGYGRDEVA